ETDFTVEEATDAAKLEDPTDPGKPALKKDQLVQVTVGEDDYAEEINILFDDYSDERLTEVDAEKANVGTVTVGGDDIEVDEDTVILLNGKKAALTDVQDALEDLQDEWGKEAAAIATVRTSGANPS